jgi:hypothetical protein
MLRRGTTTTTMLIIRHTRSFLAEAAVAETAPLWPKPADNGSRYGMTSTLTARCVR